MSNEYVDYYGLLGIIEDASEHDIKRAFRKKSLQVHPDKRPDDPKASRLFYELTVAQDILLDKESRGAFDRVRAARVARKRKHEAQTSDRRRIISDLEARETKQRSQSDAEEMLARKIAQIRSDSAKLKSKLQEDRRNSLSSPMATPKSAAATPPTTSDNCMVRVKFRRRDPDFVEGELQRCLQRFGKIEKIILIKPSSLKPDKKYQMGLVVFHSASDAMAAVRSGLRDDFINSVAWTTSEPSPSTPISSPAPSFRSFHTTPQTPARF